MTIWISCFFISFIGMEFAAWALHKYVMHGFLWWVHLDHHVLTGKKIQKNDFFAFFFAVPSFLSILAGTYFWNPFFSGIGFGILAYGLVYFTVHEVIIHRRWHFFRGRHWYFMALIMAHRDHHKVYGKEGAENFGMLWVTPKYFSKARQLIAAKQNLPEEASHA